jgi:hypothetical protein
MKSLTIISCCCAKRGEQPSQDYETLAIRLAQSIRRNAEAYRDCRVVFYSDSNRQPSEATAERLKSLDCELVYGGETPIPGYEGSNKLSACCIPFDTDYAYWFDTDMYVLGDISALLETDSDVIVSPDARSYHPWTRLDDAPLWDKLYNYLGTVRPPQTIITHQDKKVGNLSFEGGVFGFRRGTQFGERLWKTYSAVYNSGILGKDIHDSSSPHRFPYDFVALPLTIVKYGLSYSQLEEKYHYYYGLHDCKLEGDVRIVHYQGARVTEVTEKDWEV